MNRRKAIGRIIFAGIGGGLLVSGYEWFHGSRQPDIHGLEQHSETITALADTLIPPTPDAPGATEAGVTSFIILMIRECVDHRTANKFIAGVQDVDDYSRRHYNQPFRNCSVADRHAILTHFEQRDRPLSALAGKIEARLLGASFFATLKHCTATAYCTSQQGATKGLTYVPVPGSYHGCIPKTPGQKGWATK